MPSAMPGFDPSSTELCRCGRPNGMIHCPYCGSANCYGMTSTFDELVDPENHRLKVQVAVFKCRKCTSRFNYYDMRFHCEAPKKPGNKSVRGNAKANAASTALGGLAEEDRMKAIRALLANKGLDPTADPKKAIRPPDVVGPEGPDMFDLGPGEDK